MMIELVNMFVLPIVVGVMFGFLLTIIETVVLAANNWQYHKRKTPLYTRVPSVLFCDAFKEVLYRYLKYSVTIAVCLFVIVNASFGMYYLWFMPFESIDAIFIISFLILLIVALLFLITVAASVLSVLGILFGLFLLVKVIYSKLNSSKVLTNSKLTVGINNWYEQIKEKHCPFLTKEIETKE